jgi:hypothetical protein
MARLLRTLLPSILVLACGFTVFRAADDPAADAKRIASLIQQLGDKKFEQRQQASAALEAIGEPALQELRRAARDDADLEVRRRAGALVASIEGRFQAAQVFAREVLAVTGIVHEQYVVEIAQGELCSWALRGLYDGCKQELPADLVKRADKAKDLKAEELQALSASSRNWSRPRASTWLARH